MDQDRIVNVRNVDKWYDKTKILDNISLSVEKGTIYGLLGASGCGKTTLLGCILGRKTIENGEVRVFGKIPGSKDSGVPGPRIGYMPQDVALVPEYTVKETIFYFGRIANMKDDDITKRFDELFLLLDLPSEHQLVTECSGGQQRRISLAAAIVHQPQLLILDEPTVGVDAILRDKIWTYFLDSVRLQGISIILTTHYVEECNDANMVGFMRNGKILAEDLPSHILAFYQVESLEGAFLKMCVRDDQGIINNTSDGNQHVSAWVNRPSSSSSIQSVNLETKFSEDIIVKSPTKLKRFMGISARTIYALLDKNIKQFYRNIFGLILFCVLPMSQTIFFLYCIGGPIRDLKLAIINKELSLLDCQKLDRNLFVTPNPETYECRFSSISCRFLEYLDNPMITKIYYDSLSKAKDGILHGEHVGVLYIGTNFTESYQKRVKDIFSVDQSTLENGQIDVYLDMSNRETGGALKYKLHELFLDFQADLYDDCMWNRRLGSMPIRKQYLFGRKDDSFVIFLMPGILITIAFFFGTTMTSHIMVSEKCEGVWERSLSTGVTTLEITLGHLMPQIFLSLFQCVAPLLICFFIYGMEYRGNLGDMLVTLTLQSICGLTFGFWISVESKTHTDTHILINGILYPSIILCGILWPLECLPISLQIVAKCLPFTLPTHALRNMIRKGWSLWDPIIIGCNAISIAWIIFFVVISLIRLKRST